MLGQHLEGLSYGIKLRIGSIASRDRRRWAKKKEVGRQKKVPNFFFWTQNKNKDGLKNGLWKFKIEILKKVKENVSKSQKYHPSVAPGRLKKKKRWAVDGQCAIHQIKMKKMGCKKKVGEMPIFLKLIVGAHLSPIPNRERYPNLG